MSQCSNPKCRAKLSCGCQRRIASDGASVCTNCVASYERDIVLNRQKKANPTDAINNPSLIINSVTYNPPKT